jgi:SAM-dependent methyltransferase
LDVLDFASGAGSGSVLLAQVARSVVGVEVSEELVASAEAAYKRPNLRFLHDDARSIPLSDASIDVVVSYDTVERFYELDLFVAEVRRVLRPGGRFVVSCHQREAYPQVPRPVNPRHVRELTREEFGALLRAYFGHVSMYAQRPMLGSALMPEAPLTGEPALWTFEGRDATHFEASPGLPRPLDLVAVASDVPLEDGFGALYIETGSFDRFFSRLAEVDNEAKALSVLLSREREGAARVRAELADRTVELADRVRDLERCRAQLLQSDEENQSLAAAYQWLWSEQAALRLERDAAQARLTGVLDSATWRMAMPLLGIAGNCASLLAYGKDVVGRRRRARRP